MTKSKIAQATENIADKVVGAYQTTEDAVTGTYNKIENGVTGTYTKIEDAFVDRFLTRKGESIEEAKERLQENRVKREERRY